MSYNHKHIPFEDLPVDFSGKVVFLDMDGTLGSDGMAEFSGAVHGKVQELKRRNTVLLCTNTPHAARIKQNAAALGIAVLESGHKKPSKKIISGLDFNGAGLVVIGDKFLTDGLFAKNIGAHFIKVQRKVSMHNSWMTWLGYLLDDIVYHVLVRGLKIINI